MARVVLIVDSETGALIDVAGNIREGGRFKRFVKRMLSLDKNPVLDYGVNGGDTLTISKGGGRGAVINLKADVVNIDGELRVRGATTEGSFDGGSSDILDSLDGTEGQISLDETYVEDETSGEMRKVIKISLDQSVVGKLDMINAALGGVSNLVKRSEVASLATDLSVQEGDGIEELKGTVRVLLERIAEMSESSSSSGSSS